METINFGGIHGKVLALSPHKSYFILKLLGRIAIKGIYNSDFVWDTTTDNLKGFLSNRFTLYVGTRSNVRTRLIKEKITKAGGKPDEDIRVSRYVLGSPYEVRAIGLSPEYIVQAVEGYLL